MTHHMSDWVQVEMPQGVVGRVCEHGLAHPDPEDLVKKAKSGGFMANIRLAHHECDGCCVDLDLTSREDRLSKEAAQESEREKRHRDLSG